MRIVVRDGLAPTEVGRKLKISSKTICSCVTGYKNQEGEGLAWAHSSSELVGEVNRLRKELAQSKMKTEILKDDMFSSAVQCAW